MGPAGDGVSGGSLCWLASAASLRESIPNHGSPDAQVPFFNLAIQSSNNLGAKLLMSKLNQSPYNDQLLQDASHIVHVDGFDRNCRTNL